MGRRRKLVGDLRRPRWGCLARLRKRIGVKSTAGEPPPRSERHTCIRHVGRADKSDQVLTVTCSIDRSRISGGFVARDAEGMVSLMSRVMF